MHDTHSVACFPVVRAPLLVGNDDHGRLLAVQVVPDGVGKLAENAEVNTVIVRRSNVSLVGQSVDRLEDLGAQGVRSDRTALEVPNEGLAKLPLGVRQNLDGEPTYIALKRARTLGQGAPCTAPAQSCVRRRNNSVRQASDTELSSPVSRLSMSAAATAEHSSAESRRTSSRTWSTRAFMGQSVAAGPAPQEPPDPWLKPSLDDRPASFRRLPLGTPMRTGKPNSRRPERHLADAGRRAQPTDSRQGAKEFRWIA